MEMRNPRDRIWLNMHNTERMARYFSRRSEQLEMRHKMLTFPIALIPIVAIAILQFEWESKYLAASVILLIAAVLELALIHFGSGGDVKAAKIMGNQAARLAEEWRRLWVDQRRDSLVQWIELLEGQTSQITAEGISYRKRLNDECFEEVEYEFAYKFGG